MKFYLNAIFLFIGMLGYGQNWEYNYRNPSDSSFNAYAIVLPDSVDIKGLIIRDFSSLPDLTTKSRYKWSEIALERGLAILYTTTTNFFPELFYDDNGPALLDDMLQEVIKKYAIPKSNLFIGGISASGTRALRFVQYCEKGKSRYGTRIKAAFSVDSPLDLERFYLSASSNRDKFKKGMLWEAALIMEKFPLKLGDFNTENIADYRASSVYSFKSKSGGNAQFLLNVPLLFFHEPDMDWWINERGSTYFDINSFDIIGLVNWLKFSGHENVKLITSTQKGYDKNGNRNCHSWTIVDEVFLINWMEEQID